MEVKNDIQLAARNLAKEIGWNRMKAPVEQVAHTATVVLNGDTMVAVNGSAHQLQPLFVDLLKERSELRQVMEAALQDYARLGTR